MRRQCRAIAVVAANLSRGFTRIDADEVNAKAAEWHHSAPELRVSMTTPGQIQLKHAAVTDKIIGVFYDVYNELGHGFLESVYEEAMSISLGQSGLRVERQLPVRVLFRGRIVGDFRADMIVEGCVLVELKAVRGFDPCHEAQLLNYLRGTELEVGLLFNFGPKPEFKRLVFENSRKGIGINASEGRNSRRGFTQMNAGEFIKSDVTMRGGLFYEVYITNHGGIESVVGPGFADEYRNNSAVNMRPNWRSKNVTFQQGGGWIGEATVCAPRGFFPMWLKTDSMRCVSQTLRHLPCRGTPIALLSRVPLPGGYAPKSDF